MDNAEQAKFSYLIQKHFRNYQFDYGLLTKLIQIVEEGKKGIMLAGGIGSGKTTLMRLLQFYYISTDYTFDIVSSMQIMRDFATKGYDGLDRYINNTTLNSYNVEVQNPRTICIDDVGIEIEVENYGNRLNPVEYILLERYELYQRCNIRTHITTNYNKQHIKDRYSNRLISRIREMFQYVELLTNDRRI